MDKYYTKKALALKAVFSLLLGPVYVLISLIVPDAGFVSVVAALIPIGCIYTVPFWLTLIYIHKYRANNVRRAFLLDCAFCFLPALLGVVSCEAVSVLVNGPSPVDGFISIVFCAVFALVTSAFGLAYFLTSRGK